MTDTAHSVAHRAESHPVVQQGARLGFVVTGLLHLLIAWIAFRIAWGGDSGGEEADQSGALAMLADAPAGSMLLWVAVAAFLLLALWFLVEAITARWFDGVAERLGILAKAIVYAVLAFSALRITQRAGGSSEESTQSFTAQLLSTPGGQFLVGAVGLGIIGVGVFHVYRGWTKSFDKFLVAHPGRFVMESGRIGYIAKGLAFGIIGALFINAAAAADAAEAGGLDGALRAVRDQPFGPYLLTVVAIGIAAFGVFSFGQARFAKL